MLISEENMVCLSGSHTIEGFIHHSEMEKFEEERYPEQHTETFLIQEGSVDYYANHLNKLRNILERDHGYSFDVGKFAQALYHIGRIDGFLNADVLSDEGDGPGRSVKIQYRTDKPYVLRVPISEGGWYVIAPRVESEEQLEELHEKGDEQ